MCNQSLDRKEPHLPALHTTGKAQGAGQVSLAGFAVTQKLLEHSSPNLTNKVYTNVDLVLRESVNQLPIEQ